jgi:hypothetical protein
LAQITRVATSSMQRRSIRRDDRSPIAYWSGCARSGRHDPAMMVALLLYALRRSTMTIGAIRAMSVWSSSSPT